MSAPPIAAGQIKAIKAIATRTGLPDSSYRAMLQEYGATSCKQLTASQADRLLSCMRALPGASRQVQRPSTVKADGPYCRKLQAMWIALWNLGVVRDNRDAALHAFVKHQTGIQHTRFLRAHSDATGVIEALKVMLERDGGVFFPPLTGDEDNDRLAMKREIIRAQWRRCMALGAVTAIAGMDPDDAMERWVSKAARGNARAMGSLTCPTVTAAELDEAAKALGRKLRTAQEEDGRARHAG